MRTKATYFDWVKRFILCHGKRHPRELGAPEVAALLSHLAVSRSVAPSTQNQAKPALLFRRRDERLRRRSCLRSESSHSPAISPVNCCSM